MPLHTRFSLSSAFSPDYSPEWINPCDGSLLEGLEEVVQLLAVEDAEVDEHLDLVKEMLVEGGHEAVDEGLEVFAVVLCLATSDRIEPVLVDFCPLFKGVVLFECAVPEALHARGDLLDLYKEIRLLRLVVVLEEVKGDVVVREERPLPGGRDVRSLVVDRVEGAQDDVVDECHLERYLCAAVARRYVVPLQFPSLGDEAVGRVSPGRRRRRRRGRRVRRIIRSSCGAAHIDALSLSEGG